MSAPLSQGGHLSRRIKKAVGKKRDALVGEPAAGSPADIAGSDAMGPYLLHTGSDLRGQSPSSEDTSSDERRTQDENKEMFANAYRRGLRIRGLRKSFRVSLSFLFDEF